MEIIYASGMFQAEKKYDVVLIDPPWYYATEPRWFPNHAIHHYPTMKIDELCALPVRSLMSNKSVMFCCTTCRMVQDACKFIESQDLYYKGVAFIWVKTNKNGEVSPKFGMIPAWTKPQAEMILVATTIKGIGRPFPLLDINVPQIIQHPRIGHSRKPEVFRQMIDRMCGDRPKIELFARCQASGWDVFGNEVSKFSSAA